MDIFRHYAVFRLRLRADQRLGQRSDQLMATTRHSDATAPVLAGHHNMVSPTNMAGLAAKHSSTHSLPNSILAMAGSRLDASSEISTVGDLTATRCASSGFARRTGDDATY
jgi:hypothetical protein